MGEAPGLVMGCGCRVLSQPDEGLAPNEGAIGIISVPVVSKIQFVKAFFCEIAAAGCKYEVVRALW